MLRSPPVLSFVALVLELATAAVAAEPIVVILWPGAAPGDLGLAAAEKARIHPSPIVGATKLITNVTQPTITVRRPPARMNTGTAMIICPGGGYWDLYWELEGEEVAAWLNSVGSTGVILKYRGPRRPGEPKGEPPPGPLLDAQRAVSMVRSRAAEWGIDPQRIGIAGFSAGGHLALATATSFERRRYERIDVHDDASCRPDFAVRCSRVLETNAAEKYVVIGAGAIVSALKLPFGWHVLDDGRRTLVFDAGGKVQISLNLRRDDGDARVLLAQILEQARAKQPEIDPLRLDFAADLPGLVRRNFRDGDDVLVQAYLVKHLRDDGLAHVARVTASPDDMTRAMNLVEIILRSLGLPVAAS